MGHRPNVRSPRVVAALAVLLGGLLGGYGAVLGSGLFFGPVRKALVALGAGTAVLGAFVGYAGRYRPLNPKRAWVVPVCVALALVGLLLYDLQASGGSDLLGDAGTTEALLLAAACGFPLGAAIQKERQRRAKAALGVGVLALAGAFLLSPVLRLSLERPRRWLFPTAIAAVFWLPAVAVGYLLTADGDPEDEKG